MLHYVDDDPEMHAPAVAETPPRRKRGSKRPDLRKLEEHADPVVAKAAQLMTIEARILEILAPFPPEKRRRILLAVAILHGVEL